MASIFFWSGIVLMGLATLGGWFPLWKSSRLSPDAIQRRVYWIGGSLSAVMFFLSQLPDWKAGLFFGICMALGLVAIAFNWTGHVKIGGRIYAAFPNLRRCQWPS